MFIMSSPFNGSRRRVIVTLFVLVHLVLLRLRKNLYLIRSLLFTLSICQSSVFCYLECIECVKQLQFRLRRT